MKALLILDLFFLALLYELTTRYYYRFSLDKFDKEWGFDSQAEQAGETKTNHHTSVTRKDWLSGLFPWASPPADPTYVTSFYPAKSLTEKGPTLLSFLPKASPSTSLSPVRMLRLDHSDGLIPSQTCF